MHIKWMHGQWEIVFVLSDRLNIVKLLLNCIVHTVNSFSLHSCLLTYKPVIFSTLLSLSASDTASPLCMVVAICNIVIRFKNMHATRKYEHGREKKREAKRGARLGFDRLALGFQLDLSAEVR